MDKTNNYFWSDSKPYYFIYEDKYFLKSIYAQLFSSYPDIGQITYIGTNTKKFSKDYSLNGEEYFGEDLNKNNYKSKEDTNKNIKQDNRKKAGINVCDSNEESEIREYSNIKEIKEMNNILFYKQMLKRIVSLCKKSSIEGVCHIKGKICMYEKYKEENDIFVKIDNCCVWLKKEYMDTTAINMNHILGEVNLIGFVLENESNVSPRVIKAIAIYI